MAAEFGDARATAQVNARIKIFSARNPRLD
jgi:hypothetical protein